MKEYEISIAVIGVAHVTVEAESEEDALRQAEDMAGPDDVDEWMAHRVLVEGNVYYGPINRARIDNSYDQDGADA